MSPQTTRLLRGTVAPASAVSDNDLLGVRLLMPPSSADAATLLLGFNCVPSSNAYTVLAPGSTGGQVCVLLL